MKVHSRQEQPKDYKITENVIKRAFANMGIQQQKGT